MREMSVKTLLITYIVLNVVAFLGWALVGASIRSTAGGIPGYAGSSAEQVFWYAVGSTLSTATTFGGLALAVVYGTSKLFHHLLSGRQR
jgi:hypothetical protein